MREFTHALKKSEFETLSRHLAYGCVTMESSGSHEDMNAETFLTSIDAIARALHQIDWREVSSFESLRKKGFYVETVMFQETEGVNTHKGLVFLLVFLLEAWIAEVPFQQLQPYIQKRAMPLALDYEKPVFERASQLRAEGLRDIRQIPITGFETVLTDALWMESGHDIGELSLRLIADYDDTTTVKRGSVSRMRDMQALAREALEAEGEERLYQARALNEIYLRENLSSGGVADLITTIRLIQRLYLGLRP